MIEIAQNATKTRCFFANMCFRFVLCDSNHKKTGEKSPTIFSLQKKMGFFYWGNLLMFI